MFRQLCAKRLGCGRVRGPSPTSRVGRPTTLGVVRLAGIGVGYRCGPYLRIDRRALHLVECISNLFQIGDVSAVWIEGSVPRRSFGEGIDEELLNTTRMNLEMEFVRDRV